MTDRRSYDDDMETARATISGIVLSSASDEQVVARLNAAGFDGDGATLTPIEAGPAYLVRVETRTPDGRPVTVFRPPAPAGGHDFQRR